MIAGRAIHEGPQTSVHTRIAETDGGILLDLADDQWRAVKITSAGWTVITDVPVKFRRTRGALPIPEPTRGGSLDELHPFINLPDETQWSLFKAFLISALRPNRPQPILILTGEQGVGLVSGMGPIDGRREPTADKLEFDYQVALWNGGC